MVERENEIQEKSPKERYHVAIDKLQEQTFYGGDVVSIVGLVYDASEAVLDEQKKAPDLIQGEINAHKGIRYAYMSAIYASKNFIEWESTAHQEIIREFMVGFREHTAAIIKLQSQNQDEE